MCYTLREMCVIGRFVVMLPFADITNACRGDIMGTFFLSDSWGVILTTLTEELKFLQIKTVKAVHDV